MRLFSVCALALVATLGFSQSPNAFKYQSVLRDKNGLVITDKTVSVRISILQTKIDGTTVYSETHSAKTSASGIINLEIGRGAIVSGSFSNIAWGANLHFVKIEMDPAGGSTFELVGVSQLLSVPYALFAQSSGDQKWDNATGGISYKSGNVGIGTTSPSTNLEIVGQGSSNPFVFTTRNNSSNSISVYSAGDTDFLQASTALFRSRGTTQSPTNLLPGDRIGLITGNGYANGGYNTQATIQMYAGVNLGSFMTFETTSSPLASRAERMRITENGNIGIGKNNPSYALDVAGTINASALLVNGSPIVGSSPWNISGNNISYSAGNVGIGTTTPSTNLEIIGPGSSNSFLLTTKNNWSNAAAFYAAGNVDFLQSSIGMFRSRGTYQSPAPVLAGDRIGSYGAFGYTSAAAYNTGGAMEMYAGSSLGTYLIFGTTATPGATRLERVRITETGNVGIGTTTPAYSLDVAGSINANSVLVNGSPVSSSPWSLSGSNISYSSGNVGIGTSTPSTNLEVIGQGSSNPFVFTTRNNWSNSISVYSAGDVDFLQASTALFRSRGTTQSPTNLLPGDRIGLITGNGYANGGYNTQATIQMYAGANLGSYMTFETTPSPLVARTERVRVTENGNLIVKTADVYISNIGSGVIMKSPDGNCWRMTVGNTGLPVFTTVVCPQ
jgi:hypothetical protein